MEKNERKKNIIGKVLLFSATLVWGSSFVILKDTLSELGNGNLFIAASFSSRGYSAASGGVERSDDI